MNEATPVSEPQEADDLEDLFENAPCGYLSAAAERPDLQGQPDLLGLDGLHRRAARRTPVPRPPEHRGQDLLRDPFRAAAADAGLLQRGGARHRVRGRDDAARSSSTPSPAGTRPAQFGSSAMTVFNASDRRRYERELLEARRRCRERPAVALQDLNATLEARVAERPAQRDRAWRLSQDLLAVARADGVLSAVNAAWTDLLGWQASDLVGATFVPSPIPTTWRRPKPPSPASSRRR